MAERLNHFVDSRQLTPELLINLYKEMEHIENNPPGRARGFEDRMALLAFHGPSDITQAGFARAIGHLRWQMYDRVLPGQTSWDDDSDRQVRLANLHGFDVVILRSGKIGGAETAASNSQIPVINAGEGFNGERVNGLLRFAQHPPQALTDGYTLYKRRAGAIEGVKIVITGDIRENPVANGWFCTFANFPQVEITLATKPFPDKVHEDIEAHLASRGVTLVRVGTLEEALPNADVLCIAHSKHTKRADVPALREISADILEALPRHATVIHDLIKGILPEVAEGADHNHRMAHEQQIANGVIANMALLRMLVK